MCDCKKIEGFSQSLSKANFLTAQTGETYVVYVHKAVNLTFVRKESDLSDDLGICCYFLPDGTEVEYKAQPVVEQPTEETSVISKKTSAKKSD